MANPLLQIQQLKQTLYALLHTLAKLKSPTLALPKINGCDARRRFRAPRALICYSPKQAGKVSSAMIMAPEACSRRRTMTMMVMSSSSSNKSVNGSSVGRVGRVGRLLLSPLSPLLAASTRAQRGLAAASSARHPVCHHHHRSSRVNASTRHYRLLPPTVNARVSISCQLESAASEQLLSNSTAAHWRV